MLRPAVAAVAVQLAPAAARCLGSRLRFSAMAAQIEPADTDLLPVFSLDLHEERRLDKVGKAVQFLDRELNLPPGDVQRVLPNLMRAPHFVQNRLRLLRSLGLTNADVATLVSRSPDVLALPPAASAPVLEERMRLLGLRPANLVPFLLQSPTAAPLLLRCRLTADDVGRLRSMVGGMAVEGRQ